MAGDLLFNTNYGVELFVSATVLVPHQIRKSRVREALDALGNSPTTQTTGSIHAAESPSLVAVRLCRRCSRQEEL